MFAGANNSNYISGPTESTRQDTHLNVPDEDYNSKIHNLSGTPLNQNSKDSDFDDDEDFFDTSATMGAMKKGLSQALPKIENKLGADFKKLSPSPPSRKERKDSKDFANISPTTTKSKLSRVCSRQLTMGMKSFNQHGKNNASSMSFKEENFSNIQNGF